MAEEKPPEKKKRGKRPKKKHVKIKKGEQYRVEGRKIQRLKTPCPKCGPGVFMAEHGNRLHCGKCGYTMMKGSKPEASPEPKEKPGEAPVKTEETKPKEPAENTQ